MTVTYIPKSVCSRQITFDIEDNIVTNVKFIGGCNGNLQGISKLVEGLPADKIIEKLQNIRCGTKFTSCPDQLAHAIKENI